MNNDVSVIIPTYNQKPEYLRCAIDSVLSQTSPPRELIISNDGGDSILDFIQNILLGYCNGPLIQSNLNPIIGDTFRWYTYQLDSSNIVVKLLESDRNVGTAGALNGGISLANGKYISWLSSDDFFYPQFLELHIACLNKDTLATYSGFSELTYNESGLLGAWGDYRPMGFDNGGNMPRRWQAKEFNIMLKHCLFNGSCAFNGCCFVIAKEVYKEIGGFNTEFTFSQDFEMWFRVSKKFDIVMLPQILLCRRNHTGRTYSLFSNDEYQTKREWEFDQMRKEFANG